MRKIPRCASVFAAVVVGVFTAGCSDGSTKSSGTSSTTEIGAAGGTITRDGVSLEVPAGALTTAAKIEVGITAESAPADVVTRSPVFRFQPEGLTFAVPATVRISFDGTAAHPRIFWSKQGAAGFDDLGGDSDGDHRLVAKVTHFSRGFVGEAPVTTVPTLDAGQPATDAQVPVDAGACSCGAGLVCCTGACVDPKTSVQNCGGCGMACANGQGCINGTCAAGG